MDTRNGEIMDRESLRKKMGEDAFNLFAKEIHFSEIPMDKQRILKKSGRTKIGRNDHCPCGSGKKFKVCCLRVESD